jgi:hypothetical protein
MWRTALQSNQAGTDSHAAQRNTGDPIQDLANNSPTVVDLFKVMSAMP